ncbi:MAG: CRISPR-associated protein Cas4 [Clostridiales bacterium]|jgi:CRISPR-associated exonuclease Cas4|nr:CRISPR-associated protein Cas4 [Clostridiales bacterium]
MQEYSEDNYILISGIQHFAFCPRQWALIHIEDVWQDNYLTVGGNILHNKAHDGDSFEKRGNIIIIRGLKISSKLLGVSGQCDVVEFHKSDKGIPINRYDGLWIPYPVEYKRGKIKIDNCDRLQLCAQAVCLEEMLGCQINEGALFYGEIRRREVVNFSKELRDELIQIVKLMHQYFNRQHIPKVKIGKHCKSCSLKDKCLPKLLEKDKKDVRLYLEKNIQ